MRRSGRLAIWIAGFLGAGVVGIYWILPPRPLANNFHTPPRTQVTFRNLTAAEALQSTQAPRIVPRYRDVVEREGVQVFSEGMIVLQEQDLQDREQTSINLGERYAAYFGGLHSHTGWSDGKGTPDEAFTFAEKKAKNDFWAVTEHPEYWLFGDGDRWQQLDEIARAHTSKTFIALRGFEHSHIVNGHFGILGSSTYCGADRCPTQEAFYRWLATEPHALVTYAHPGFRKGIAKAIEFNGFQLENGALSPQIIGMEVIHWSGYRPFLEGLNGHESFMDLALKQGRKLAPMGSQDNHFANWGASGANRVALLLPRLTREALFEALRARRFYATTNDNLQFAFNIKLASGRWGAMGEEVRWQDVGQEAELRVRFFDPDNRTPPGKLELVCNGEVVGTHTFELRTQPSWQPYIGGEFMMSLRPPQEGGSTYCYVRFFQGNDLDTFTQSAPIWLRQ